MPHWRFKTIEWRRASYNATKLIGESKEGTVAANNEQEARKKVDEILREKSKGVTESGHIPQLAGPIVEILELDLAPIQREQLAPQQVSMDESN